MKISVVRTKLAQRISLLMTFQYLYIHRNSVYVVVFDLDAINNEMNQEALEHIMLFWVQSIVVLHLSSSGNDDIPDLRLVEREYG